MKKAIGITILILAASLIIYFLLFSYGKIYSGNIKLITSVHQHKIFSIREIDSLTADMNYGFTIKNAVTHPNPDSLKIPFKPERPSI